MHPFVRRARLGVVAVLAALAVVAQPVVAGAAAAPPAAVVEPGGGWVSTPPLTVTGQLTGARVPAGT
ncbi:hypothetical protein, partial [Cellulomonas septica]